MTAQQRTILRRTRRLTAACHIAIALIDIALFTRRHARIVRPVLTTAMLALAIIIGASDLGLFHAFGWL